MKANVMEIQTYDLGLAVVGELAAVFLVLNLGLVNLLAARALLVPRACLQVLYVCVCVVCVLCGGVGCCV